MLQLRAPIFRCAGELMLRTTIWCSRRILDIQWHDFVRDNSGVAQLNILVHFPLLSSYDIYHCLGKWLVWMRRLMQTEY